MSIGDRWRNLEANQTAAASLADLFGLNFQLSPVRAVEVRTFEPGVIASRVGPEVLGARVTADLDAGRTLHLPFDRRAATAELSLAAVHADAVPETLEFGLFDPAGTQLAAAERMLAGGGSIRERLSDLFGIPAPDLPFSGYVRVTGSGLRAVLTADGGAEVQVPGIEARRRRRMIVPYAVWGGGYDSILTLVNTSVGGRVVVTPHLTGTGSPLSPFEVAVAPDERVDIDLGTVFDLPSTVLSGTGGPRTAHLVVETDSGTPNPFSSPPELAVSLEVRFGDVVAVAPVQTTASRSAGFHPISVGEDRYAGLAVTNDLNATAEVTVTVFGADGEPAGAATFVVPPRSTSVRLLREIVETSVGLTEGAVSVSSNRPVLSVMYLGTTDLTRLRYVPPQ